MELFNGHWLGHFCKHLWQLPRKNDLTTLCRALGTWQISSHARCRTQMGVITVGYLQRDGYLRVQISGGAHFVHRLVARAFLDLPSGI